MLVLLAYSTSTWIRPSENPHYFLVILCSTSLPPCVPFPAGIEAGSNDE